MILNHEYCAHCQFSHEGKGNPAQASICSRQIHILQCLETRHCDALLLVGVDRTVYIQAVQMPTSEAASCLPSICVRNIDTVFRPSDEHLHASPCFHLIVGQGRQAVKVEKTGTSMAERPRFSNHMQMNHSASQVKETAIMTRDYAVDDRLSTRSRPPASRHEWLQHATNIAAIPGPRIHIHYQKAVRLPAPPNGPHGVESLAERVLSARRSLPADGTLFLEEYRQRRPACRIGRRRVQRGVVVGCRRVAPAQISSPASPASPTSPPPCNDALGVDSEPPKAR